MERLSERLQIARRALNTLREMVAIAQPGPVERDATIQRFEYSFEAIWKAAQLFLKEREGIEAGSPKAVIRALLPAGILDEAMTRAALQMADDRNLTSHAYNEALSLRIAASIVHHATLLDTWLARMESAAH